MVEPLYSNIFYNNENVDTTAFKSAPDCRGISQNEVRAYYKNKVEHQRMLDRQRMLDHEAKFECTAIRLQTKKLSKCVDTIDRSTGHSNFTAASHATSSTSASGSGSGTTTTTSSFLESIRSASGSSKSVPTIRQRPSSMHISSRLLNREQLEKRPKSSGVGNSDAESRAAAAKEILAKIEDASERAKDVIERLYQSRSIGILPQNRIRSRSVHSAFVFNQNPAEWNTYGTQKKLHENIDITKLDIEDQRLLAVYLDKCEMRKSVPKVSQKLVANLKQKDPVFAKRYRQVSEARICNRAPNFDLTDNDLNSKNYPGFHVLRLKKKVLNNAMKSALVNRPKILQHEMLKVDQKVKQFLKEVKVTQLC